MFTNFIFRVRGLHLLVRYLRSVSTSCDTQTIFHAMGIAEYHGPRSQMKRVYDNTTMAKHGSAWGEMAGVSPIAPAKEEFTDAPAIIVSARREEDIVCDLGIP